MQSLKTLKIVILGMLMLYGLLFLAACTTDEMYTLSNGYTVMKLNDDTVVFCKEDSEIKGCYNYVIRDYHVSSFCKVEQYVIMAGYRAEDGRIDEGYEEEPLVYYIFDTEKEKTVGTFSNEGDVRAKLDELRLDQEIDWTKTGNDATEPGLLAG